jgi:hypothetical protein
MGEPMPRPTGETPSLVNCPSFTPVEDLACEFENIVCTYGDNPVAECRQKMTCTSGKWRALDQRCPQPPNGYCEDLEPQAACIPIDVEGQQARFGSGQVACVREQNSYCYCEECPDGDCENGYRWSCTSAPEDLACPALLPNLGQPCVDRGLTCRYGDPCRGGGLRVCRDGAWHPRGVDCLENP